MGAAIALWIMVGLAAHVIAWIAVRERDDPMHELTGAWWFCMAVSAPAAAFLGPVAIALHLVLYRLTND